MEYKNNKVSVLICTGNRPIRLELCLKNILVQCFFINEVVILDSSEVNNFTKLFFKKKYPELKIRYFTTKVRSIPYSRNFLLKKSRSNLCFFVDDDIVLDKDAIRQSIASLKKNKLTAVVGGFSYPRYDKNIYSYFSYRLLFSTYPNDINNKNIEVSYCPIGICCLRKNILLKNKLQFDLSLKNLEDIDICLQLNRCGEKIILNKKIKGIHEYRTDFKSFYKTFYNYYLYVGVIYRKHNVDIFGVEKLLNGRFWVEALIYFLRKDDYFLENSFRNRPLAYWVCFLRKLAMVSAIRNFRSNQREYEIARVEEKK